MGNSSTKNSNHCLCTSIAFALVPLLLSCTNGNSNEHYFFCTIVLAQAVLVFQKVAATSANFTPC